MSDLIVDFEELQMLLSFAIISETQIQQLRIALGQERKKVLLLGNLIVV